MKMFNTSAMILFMFLTVLLIIGSSCAYTVFLTGSGYMCSDPDNSIVDPTFQENLHTFFSSLPENVVLHHGFYKTRVGKGPEGIYGIIQCRGDISSSDCSNCTSEAMSRVLRRCPNSRDVAIWFRSCMLRYSNESIFGVWEKETSIEIPAGNGTDSPAVSSKGFSMMSMLASTTPDQPGMVQSSAVDVGQGRKRYGLAQCRRDISKSDCGQCLNGQLLNFGVQIGNQSGWDIYGLSCSMWYNVYKFYSNISTIGISGDGKSSGSNQQFGVYVSSSMLMLIFFSS